MLMHGAAHVEKPPIRAELFNPASLNRANKESGWLQDIWRCPTSMLELNGTLSLSAEETCLFARCLLLFGEYLLLFALINKFLSRELKSILDY